MSLLLLFRPKYSESVVDTHDGFGGGDSGKRKKKKQNEILIKSGVGELRIIPKDDYKFSIRDLQRAEIALSEEEEFMIMLLMGEHDD
jgi:hypothetical protein